MTFGEYNNIVNEFVEGLNTQEKIKVDYSRTLLSKPVVSMYERTGKTPMDYTNEELFDIVVNKLTPSKKLSQMTHQRSYFSAFYKWAIYYGKFHRASPAEGVVWEGMRDIAVEHYYTPEDFEEWLVENVDDLVVECAFRLIYAGCASTWKDIAEVSIDQLDGNIFTTAKGAHIALDARTISLANRVSRLGDNVTYFRYDGSRLFPEVTMRHKSKMYAPYEWQIERSQRAIRVYVKTRIKSDFDIRTLYVSGVVTRYIAKYGIEELREAAKVRRGESKDRTAQSVVREHLEDVNINPVAPLDRVWFEKYISLVIK